MSFSCIRERRSTRRVGAPATICTAVASRSIDALNRSGLFGHLMASLLGPFCRLPLNSCRLGRLQVLQAAPEAPASGTTLAKKRFPLIWGLEPPPSQRYERLSRGAQVSRPQASEDWLQMNPHDLSWKSSNLTESNGEAQRI